MKTQELKEIVGLPIQEKVARVVDSNYTIHELYQLTGVNESTLTRLTEERDKPVKERSASLKLESAEKIAGRFDEMVHDGKFPEINRNTHDGITLREKVKYILNLDLKTTEIAELTGAKYISVAKLRTKENDLGHTMINNLVPFEKAFEKMVASGMIKLDQETEHLVVGSRKSSINTLVSDIYKAIREYRYGHYLVIDEDDIETQKSVYEDIKDNVNGYVNLFNISYVDDIIDNNFNVSFNFIVKISSASNGSVTFKIINKQVKKPKC